MHIIWYSIRARQFINIEPQKNKDIHSNIQIPYNQKLWAHLHVEYINKMPCMA